MEAVKENKTEEIVLTDSETTLPVEKVVPSREEMKKNGWSKSELDAAEKRGMIQKPEEKKEVKAEVKEDAAPEPKKEASQDVKEEVKEDKKVSSLPDFTIADPAKEKVFLDTFGAGTPQRAMYFRMKNERQARQQAEAEARELREKIKYLESEKTTVKRAEIDENGNEIDPDDKPLTMRQIKEMNAREAEERRKQDEELRTRGQIANEALKNQEEFAKEIYPDYDATVGLAKDLMQNLDSLISEEWKKDRVIELVRDLQIKAANADKYGVDKYNAALISYELGKYHPNYGKQADTNGKSDRPETKANGSLTPEQMERIEKNTQRRGSSASIPGNGGGRVVSAEDVSLKELNAMSPSQRANFKAKYPDRYLKLARG